MGAPFHTPVLSSQLSQAVAPALWATPERDAVLVDATCGGGGHTLAVLEQVRPRLIVLFDRDPEALAQAADRLHEAPCVIELVHAPFSRMRAELAARGVDAVAAIIADLGVSSHQLDTPQRGFSFRADGPLDMRMDPTTGPMAAEVLATLDAKSLAEILRELGEEPKARRIAAAIVAARPRTTAALAATVEGAVGTRRPGERIHPATRTFQALRILVNHELEELDTLLVDAPELLVVGGRLAIVSFHSVEDRRVKRAMQALGNPAQPPFGVPLRADELPEPRFRIPDAYRGGVVPQPDEVERNPRARSARLRVLERHLQ